MLFNWFLNNADKQSIFNYTFWTFSHTRRSSVGLSVSWPPRVVGVARSAMFRAVSDGWKRYWWGTGTKHKHDFLDKLPNNLLQCEKKNVCQSYFWNCSTRKFYLYTLAKKITGERRSEDVGRLGIFSSGGFYVVLFRQIIVSGNYRVASCSAKENSGCVKGC